MDQENVQPEMRPRPSSPLANILPTPGARLTGPALKENAIAVERSVSSASLASRTSSTASGSGWASRPSFGESALSVNVGSGGSSSNTAVTAGSRSRGYRRPLETHFSRSALNRQSVMCLGSIAHLQYYYARTGKLDGRGGQLARSSQKVGRPSTGGSDGATFGPSSGRVRPPRRAVSRASTNGGRSRSSLAPDAFTGRSISADFAGRPQSALGIRPETPAAVQPADPTAFDDSVLLSGQFCDEPDEEDDVGYDEFDEFEDYEDEWDDIMYPPTVSTYNFPRRHIELPPDVRTLRKRLMDALENCSAMLELLASGENLLELDRQDGRASLESPPLSPVVMIMPGSPDSELIRPVPDPDPAVGSCRKTEAELVGETVREATGAVRDYYLKHTRPEQLLEVTTTKKLRAGVLKTNGLVHRLILRQADGGKRITAAETAVLQEWTYETLLVLSDELEVEQKVNKARRDRWAVWLDDKPWTDPAQDRDRELKFLASLLEDDPATAELAEQLAATGWIAVTYQEPEARLGSGGGVEATLSDEKRPDIAPTPFLGLLQSGVVLVELHNAAVRASKNRTGRIGDLIANPDRPFRRAHNLRFWAKAAEARWGVESGKRLDVTDDVGAIARAVSTVEAEPAAEEGGDEGGRLSCSSSSSSSLSSSCEPSRRHWARFDQAVMDWSRIVREQLSAEWTSELEV